MVFDNDTEIHVVKMEMIKGIIFNGNNDGYDDDSQ